MKPSLEPRESMGPAIGFLEIAPIPTGYQSVDAAVKEASVELLACEPMTPGKLIALMAGEVTEITSAVARGVDRAGSHLLDHLVLAGPHPTLLPAIRGSRDVAVEALGIVETPSVAGVLEASDRAAKEAEIEVISIRFARRLGGHGLLVLTGVVAQVEEAVRVACDAAGLHGEAPSRVVIPNPDLAVIEALP